MRRLHRLAAIALGATVASGPALAEFPERNIENIYPWAPGATMAASQLIADAMGEELGVNISVVSTPGAGGVKAFETALSRESDGYTIFDGYVAPLVLQPLLGNADWSHEDFVPLWSATANSFALVVRRGEDRFADFPSLIAYMKENPRELRYSSGVPNTLPHMIIAKILMSQDAVAQKVPYPEMDVASRDLRGGVLDFMVVNTGVYTINKDDITVLAVLSDLDSASTLYGGAPLIGSFGIDLGMSGLSMTGWNWWLVKKGTPDEVVERLRQAMGAAVNRPDVNEGLLSTGYVLTLNSPDKYGEVVSAVRRDLESATGALEWERQQLEGQ